MTVFDRYAEWRSSPSAAEEQKERAAAQLGQHGPAEPLTLLASVPRRSRSTRFSACR